MKIYDLLLWNGVTVQDEIARKGSIMQQRFVVAANNTEEAKTIAVNLALKEFNYAWQAIICNEISYTDNGVTIQVVNI